MIARLHPRENALTPRSLFAVMLVSLAVAACRESPWLATPNAVPTAKAEIIGPDGQTVREPAPACPNPKLKTQPTPPTAHEAKFTYDGTDIEITLDGSHSVDTDGTIAKYKWLSGTAVPDGGMGDLSHEVTTDGGTKLIKAGGRLIPDGEGPEWHNAKVTLHLGAGLWAFSLWVTDDKGATSTPDSVTIAIGGDPRVTACAANVHSDVPDTCKTCICSQSDTCRMNVVESVCNADCWALIKCIAKMCPTFTKDMDTSCVTGMCSAFLAGVTGATAAGSCVASCSTECSESSTSMTTCDTGVPDGGK